MESNDELIAGFKLTGDYVKTLKDKHFEVITADNREFPTFNDPNKTIQKVVLTIKIDGQQVEWVLNNTSKYYIAKECGGYHLSDMIGYKGELVTVSQMVGKDLREVIFVKGALKSK